MLAPVRIEAHAYGRGTPFDLTPYVKRVTWSEGTTAPWDWVSAELALPLGSLLTSELRASNDPGDPYWLRAPAPDEPGVERTRVFETTKDGVSIDTGLWLKVSEGGTGRLLAFGRINDSPGALSGPSGALAASASVKADGALQFLRTLPTEVAVGLSESVGGIMSAATWAEYMDVITRLVKRADFGLVFGAGGLLSFIGNVRIPPTLIPGATSIADLFLPAYNADTGRLVAPLRTMDPVPIAGTTAIASMIPNGTVADVIMGTFQREPRLIEMFPSIEGATNDPTKPGYADARPVMVHRLTPWRTGELSSMVVNHEGEPSAVPIDERFENATWSLAGALSLTREEAYNFRHRRTEQGRINAVTVNWTVAGGQPVRLMSMAGLPLFDRKDVELHGAKLLELNWDMAPDQLGDFELAKRLRTIGLLGWNLYGLGHVFRVGSFESNYLGLRARAGEPVMVKVGRQSEFTAYMTRVTHTVDLQAKGAQSGRTEIEFDRGLFEERYRSPVLWERKKRTGGGLSRAQKAPEPPPPEDPLIIAGRAALAKAKGLWSLNIKDPDVEPAKQKLKQVTDAALIDRMIRGTDGIDQSRSTAYQRDGDYEWCGAFVGTCWNTAGLDLRLLRYYFASTARMNAWAYYRPFFLTVDEAFVMSLFAETDPQRRRKVLEMGESTTVDEVVAWGPREGDILIVGDLSKSIGDVANHICIVERFDPKTANFDCYDGNGTGRFPNRAQGHGVVKTSRPLAFKVAAKKDPPKRARLLIRPGYKDIGA